MFLFYDILFLMFALVYLPRLIFQQKWHKGFCMRFGFIPKADCAKLLEQKEKIWIHAVSVGEVAVTLRLIKTFQEQLPSYHIVLSTVTRTGYALAQSQLKDTCTILYAPLDFSLVVRKFISVINPKVYITAETELWPNLFSLLRKKNIPIAIINGRISDGSFSGYKKVRTLLKRILEGVCVFCMQSKSDAERIVKIGASKSRVFVTGNMKFDNLPTASDIKRKDLGYSDDDIVFIAGSTHLGEEDIIFRIFSTLSKDYPNLRLIIAPRHPERTDEVISLSEKYNLKTAKFSQMHSIDKALKPIIIVDTIGHLNSLYNAATCVFIGKSLTVGGGHNIIEPASFAKPIIVGPCMRNFKDIVEIFLREKAVLQVNNSDELLSSLRAWFSDAKAMQELGIRAKEAIEKNTGATSRTMDAILPILKQ